MSIQKIAEDNTILRVLVGSKAYGISDGINSDRDEKGVFIEPFETAMGFGAPEQFEYRDAAIRTGKKDAPSGPGDLDLTLYSLQKFLRLALKGNPSIIELFFLKNYVYWNSTGLRLQELAPHVVSKNCGKAFLGYMKAQRAKLLRGKEPEEGAARAELVAKFGYDTKFAGHMVRLGMQGIELMRTGRIILPMIVAEAEMIKDIRKGQYKLEEVLETSDNLEATLIDYIDGPGAAVPDHPNQELVEKWMLATYWSYWSVGIDQVEPISVN